VHVALAVHWNEGRISAVSATLHGHSDDDLADQSEVEPVVLALLGTAEATGGVLDSNVGTITRSSLAAVLPAL
jgi:hypothetical protein